MIILMAIVATHKSKNTQIGSHQIDDMNVRDDCDDMGNYSRRNENYRQDVCKTHCCGCIVMNVFGGGRGWGVGSGVC